MSLIDQIKADILAITTNLDEFGVAIDFTAPTTETATITGLHTKHRISHDETGVPVNAKNASISFSESALTDLDYPVRNAGGEVDLKGHLVSVKDSTGTAKSYQIREWFPDEKVGLIVCILGDYE